MRIDRVDRQVLSQKAVQDRRESVGLKVRADDEGRKIREPPPTERRDTERVAIVDAQPSIDWDRQRRAVGRHEAPFARGGEIAVEEADVRLQVVRRLRRAVS